MSTNAHLNAIRTITDTLEEWGEDVYLMGEDEPAIGGMLARINQNAEALARDLEEAQRDATLVQSHGTFVPQRWFSVHAAIVAERDRLIRGLAEAEEELEQANRHWLKANARLVAAGLEPVDADPIDDDELHALVDETGS